jgi:hypothetical protein
MYEGLGQALPGKALDQAFRREAIMSRLRAIGIPVRWAARWLEMPSVGCISPAC